jgi:hypothetical protein
MIPKYLKTHGRLVILCVRCPIIVLQKGRSTNQCLIDYLLDIQLQCVSVISSIFKSSVELFNASFASSEIVLRLFIKLIILIVLIDRIICEVHKGVLNVAHLWLYIGNGGHSY